jgi:hypothetical protein
MQIQARKCSFSLWLAVMLAIPASALGGISLVISTPSQAPPPVRIETHGSAPFTNAVWIDGHWKWSEGSYVWLGGHWERVREGSHGWQKGVWSKRGDSWLWTPGKWL